MIMMIISWWSSLYYRNMLDLIFVKVESWKFHATFDWNIPVLVSTPETNVHGTEWPQYLCWDLYVSWAYGRERPVTFMAELTFRADIRIKQTHSLTCAYARSRTRSHCDTLFISPSLSNTIHNTLKWQCQSVSSIFSALRRPYWLLALLLLTAKKQLILLSPVFRWSFSPYELRHGCFCSISK